MKRIVSGFLSAAMMVLVCAVPLAASAEESLPQIVKTFTGILVKEIPEEATQDGRTLPFYSMERKDGRMTVVYQDVPDSVQKAAPRGMVTYEKTVYRNYTSVTKVPEEIYYTEYDTAMMSNFSGWLTCVSTQRFSDGRVQAKFVGTLFGSGL